MGVSHYVGGRGGAGPSQGARQDLWASFHLTTRSLKVLHVFAERPHPSHTPVLSIGSTPSQPQPLPHGPHPSHRPHLSIGPAPYPGPTFPRAWHPHKPYSTPENAPSQAPPPSQALPPHRPRLLHRPRPPRPASPPQTPPLPWAHPTCSTLHSFSTEPLKCFMQSSAKCRCVEY